MIAHQYDSDGYYAEPIEDFGLLPNNSTHVKPVLLAGFIPRWDGKAWQQVENHKDEEGYLNGEPYRIKDYGPYPEGFSLTPPEPPKPTLEELKARAIAQIDAATSNEILAGFAYDFAGETLHFSYDSFDQQNFADSANVATRALAGEQDLPQTVTWNAYDANGNLKRVELGAADFLALYTRGALTHKALCMEKGGQRKAAIMEANDEESLAALLAEWNVQ